MTKHSWDIDSKYDQIYIDNLGNLWSENICIDFTTCTKCNYQILAIDMRYDKTTCEEVIMQKVLE